MDNTNFPVESPAPSPAPSVAADFDERVEHRYAENEGVRIHHAGVRDLL